MKSSLRPRHPSLRRAFALAEVIVVVAVVGVLSAVGYTVVTHVTSASTDMALESQVRQINSDIRIYLAAGGTLPDDATAETVVTKLKTEAANGKRIPFVAGSFIDPRLRAVMAPAASSEPRAVYNPATRRFTIVTGQAGVKQFALDGTPPAPTETEARSNSYNYAAVDGWVWDFNDGAATQSVSPDDIAGDSTTLPPLAPETSVDPVHLSQPLYSPSAGIYNVSAIATGITLTNPNTAGSSDIFYTTDNGATWLRYNGAINAPRGLVRLNAFSASLDSAAYFDSALTQATYTVVKTPTVTFSSSVLVEKDTTPTAPAVP